MVADVGARDKTADGGGTSELQQTQQTRRGHCELEMKNRHNKKRVYVQVQRAGRCRVRLWRGLGIRVRLYSGAAVN